MTGLMAEWRYWCSAGEVALIRAVFEQLMSHSNRHILGRLSCSFPVT